ncbi:MAG: conjugal transfer protein TrbE [Betaproteobacteria bacterium]|nr:conjugal transfer protein TrbE [Betaproteobacteria bacterium]
MRSLKEYRSKALGLPDLLNFAMLVGERTIDGDGRLGIGLNKSGSLMAGFTYSGPDIESSSEADLESLSAHLNHAVLRLGTGWSVHLDNVRLPAPGYSAPEQNFFPDPVTALIDEERRSEYGQDGTHFITRQAAVFSWELPTDAEQKLTRYVMRNPSRAEFDFEEQIKHFTTDMESLMAIFGGATRVTPMSSEDLMTHLHGCLTNDFHSLRPPRYPAYLDAVVGAHDFLGGFEPKIDDQHIAVISFMGYPQRSMPIILESINQLAIPFRFSLRFLFLDPHDAEKELSKYRRNWFQKRFGVLQQVTMAMGGAGSAFENTDALKMAGDADAAVAEASSGSVRYGYFTPTIILHDSDRKILHERVNVVKKHLDNRRFTTRLETTNAVEAFIGSIPGQTFENVRRPPVSSLSLMDLAPTTSVWTGSAENPNPMYRKLYGDKEAPCLFHAATTGATPYRFNLHVGDVGHTLIAGPTGAGKSVLLALIEAQFRRYPASKIFGFDKGWSTYALCNAAGGAHYDVGNEDAPLAFAPLARVNESGTERTFAERWIESICVLQGVKVDAGRRQRIHEAVEALAASEQRSIDNFYNLLQDEELRSAVSFYTSTGRAGAILAAETDSLDLNGNRFNVFEMEHLLSSGTESAKLVTVPVLMYLFHRIEQALDGSPALIVLDEAWVMLDNPQFAGKIREWLKVLRKFNTAVVFATQSLADLKDSPLRPVLQESCPTKILLPNKEAGSEQLAPLYRDLGLNEYQIRLLASSTPKSDYYVISPDGRRRIGLALGPVALAFTAVSDRKDVERVRELMGRHGKEWPLAWLRERLPSHKGDWLKQAEWEFKKNPARTPP